MPRMTREQMGSPSYRAQMPPNGPKGHVYMLSVGRALVYRKPKQETSYFAARLCTGRASYKTKWLAQADDYG